jgi:hypothetical protein
MTTVDKRNTAYVYDYVYWCLGRGRSGWVNSCWPSPAQSFQAPSPAAFMAVLN